MTRDMCLDSIWDIIHRLDDPNKFAALLYVARRIELGKIAVLSTGPLDLVDDTLLIRGLS